MTTYIVRRLLVSVPIVFGLTIVTFVFTLLMPGDYVNAMIPPDIAAIQTPETLQALRHVYGLDQPAYLRYLLWLREVFQGNLGHSLQSGQPVLVEVLERLPATLELTVTAMLFGILAGTTLGIISAIKQYSWIDQLLALVGFVWISTPSFAFAIGGIVLFSLKLHLLPTAGSENYGATTTILERFRHLILPATVLGLSEVAGFMRYARTSMLDVIQQEYVTVARAKGLRERTILLVHALRNALIPLITIIGLRIPGLIGGAVIIEHIFGWPGLGTFILSAISNRDYPTIMGVNLIVSLVVLLSNLLADIAYTVADPQIRYSET